MFYLDWCFLGTIINNLFLLCLFKKLLKFFQLKCPSIKRVTCDVTSWRTLQKVSDKHYSDPKTGLWGFVLKNKHLFNVNKTRQLSYWEGFFADFSMVQGHSLFDPNDVSERLIRFVTIQVYPKLLEANVFSCECLFYYSLFYFDTQQLLTWLGRLCGRASVP